MVMDLQDIRATLEDRVAQSNIRLFLTADPQNDEEDTIPVTMMKVSVPRITKARKMTLMSEVFMELEENFFETSLIALTYLPSPPDHHAGGENLILLFGIKKKGTRVCHATRWPTKPSTRRITGKCVQIRSGMEEGENSELSRENKQEINGQL